MHEKKTLCVFISQFYVLAVMKATKVDDDSPFFLSKAFNLVEQALLKYFIKWLCIDLSHFCSFLGDLVPFIGNY